MMSENHLGRTAAAADRPRESSTSATLFVHIKPATTLDVVAHRTENRVVLRLGDESQASLVLFVDGPDLDRLHALHRALNRALNGATLEHRRATLRVHAAHHHAATTTDANARLDIEIAVDHLNEVTAVRNDLLAVIRQVRSLAVAARQQAAADTNGARHG